MVLGTLASFGLSHFLGSNMLDHYRLRKLRTALKTQVLRPTRVPTPAVFCNGVKGLVVCIRPTWFRAMDIITM